MKKHSLTYTLVALLLISNSGIAQMKYLEYEKGVSLRNDTETIFSGKTNKPSLNSLEADFGYTTSVGLRGGFTSGISLKHFISSNAALEAIAGTRWYGLSFTGLYELHKGNAFDVPELTWVYGGGARIGFYDSRYFHNYSYSNCNDPYNPKCNPYYYKSSVITAFGLVGIGGLEYKFNEVPFTVSLDLMPNFYFNYFGRGLIDASASVRYILQ